MNPDVPTKSVTTSELFYKMERDCEYSISLFLKQHYLGMFDAFDLCSQESSIWTEFLNIVPNQPQLWYDLNSQC